ncbi:transglycosylase SLT domain-containing protein [Microvirga alba]|uniref:Transglycosylase SLT domain-containing protein n=1 Tax=Microvirga alba TaxID=2791025 RepID=A0A931BRV5_9HYPH|nr:transglycosylase SLT domain-containing protein [Microvirga alba]MBF9234883.1 transglycosylase SLT domain-containing protein [Microvirga alba]
MTVRLTASVDACQPLDFCQDDETILWLQPSRERRRRPGLRGVRALLRLTTSFSLGVCLTVATATAATAPASAASTAELSGPDLQIVPVAAAEIDLSDLQTAPVSIEPAAVDPLAAIVPVPAADTHDIRASIIKAMPLTNARSAAETRRIAHPEDQMQFGGMRVPRWIVDTILRAADATGVDPVYMMALADKESSFVTNNKASSSSAVGLFQFIAGTWLEVVRTFGEEHGLGAEAAAIQSTRGQLTVPNAAMREHILGLRRNPFLSALMAAEMMKRDRAKIESRLGRQISRSEFYFAHFFGVDSASKFMALVDGKPRQSAPRVFPAAAKANKTLFFAKAGRKTRQLTVTEVYKKIDGMIDKRLERYEDVSLLAVAEAEIGAN